MKYLPIMDLRIRHAYHADGRCADFVVEPGDETRRLLAGCRCLIQAFPDGLQVLAATADGAQPFLPLPTGKTLVFFLRLTNDDFPLFTDLTDLEGQPAPVFTTVGADQPVAVAGQTPLQALKLTFATAAQTERFVFPANTASAGFALGGRPLAGATAAQCELTGLDAAAVALAETGRAITVTAAPSPQARDFAVSYPVLPGLPPGVFARVEIVVGPPAAPGAATSAYEIRFKSRSAKWRYYLVSPPAAACAYAVDFGPTASFDPAVPDAADPVGQGLLAQYGAAARIDCFTSRTPVPAAEAVPTGLRLMKGSDGEPLPAPALRNLCSLGDKAPAFFCVVRRM